jgi:excisionase family DNA binding protein
MTISEHLRALKNALTVRQLAELLNLDEETVRRHVRLEHIPFFKIGATIRFDPSEVAVWLERKGLVSRK